MKQILIFIFVVSFINAGIFDFWNEKKAKDAYNTKKYHKSSEILKSIYKNDIREYNYANSLYKEGKYAQAREEYLKAKSIDKATVLHNIGNSYFKENNMNEAIKAYEKALAIKYDKDTKFNLDLAKKKNQNSKKQNDKSNNKPNKDQDKNQQNKNETKQNKQQKTLEINKDNTKQMQQTEHVNKEMRHIMRKLEEKKMPTIMYQSKPTQRKVNDKNPW